MRLGRPRCLLLAQVLQGEDLIANEELAVGGVEDSDASGRDDLPDLPETALVPDLDEILGKDKKVRVEEDCKV